MAIVVLDANVWLKERLLRSGMGAALLWAVRNTGSNLLLSDMTRLEILNGVEKVINEIAAETEANFATVRALIGKSQEVKFPSDEEIRVTIEGRLSELGGVLKLHHHRSEDLEAALQRVLNHLPPAHKKEEFRDCLLWEICLEIASTTGEHIVLITGDSAFFDKDKYENGLAYPLQEDLKRTGANISIHRNVEVYLETIRETVPKPNLDLVIQAIDEQTFKTVLASLSSSTYSKTELLNTKADLFLTEDLEELAVAFNFKYRIYQLEQETGVVYPEAYGIAKGSASFNSSTNSISNLQMTGYKIENVDGQTIMQNGYGYMSGVILGTRYIPYTLRRRIDQT